MPDPIGIFTTVEVVNGEPNITNFRSRAAARAHFEKVLLEQFENAEEGEYAAEIERALEKEDYSSADYSLTIQETDLYE